MVLFTQLNYSELMKMKIKIMQHFLHHVLFRLQKSHGHLCPQPQKKFNEGDLVLVCGEKRAVVCKPFNDLFDLSRNTWVYDDIRNLPICYANHNLTRHPDQSVRKLK